MSAAQIGKTEDQNEPEDAISLPLYLSGLAVSILGILAVNSALSDTQFGSTTLVLTALGFVFSIACRWLRIKLKVVEILGAFVCLYFLYRYLTHSFSFAVFIPPDITEGDLIMAIVLEWLTVVRAWVLTTDESVVFTAVTSIAMIGLVGASNINTELLVYFFAYTVCATFLLLHQTYLTQRSWNVLRAPSGSESSVITLQAVLALFSGITAIILASIVVVPLRAIGQHLSLANALKNFVGTQHNADEGASDVGTPVNLADDPTFRVGTGSGYTASDLIVMHVKPSDHEEHYYRGRTYDTYVGTGWLSSEKFLVQPLVPTSVVSRSPERVLVYPLAQSGQIACDETELHLKPGIPMQQLVTHFSMGSGNTSTLYLPNDTISVSIAPGTGLSLSQSADNNVSLSNLAGDEFYYDALSVDPDVTIAELRADRSALRSCPVSIRQRYVDQKGAAVVSLSDQEQLSLTARTIIQSLPVDRRTDFDIAEAIRDWVSHRCVYSLDVSAVPSGDDAVSYFLYESRKGYCDLFASSMAILCRYAGLPSRVVTGFDSGVQNDHGGYDLRERDKHAWVEVWFAGYGWQTFDPTEGSVEDTSVNGNKYTINWLWNALAAARLFFDIHGVLPFVFGGSIGIGLLYILKVEFYERLFGDGLGRVLKGGYISLNAARKVSENAAALYSKNSAQLRYLKFEKMLGLAGLQRDKAQTPREFLSIVEAVFDRIDSPVKLEADEFIAAARELTTEVMMASYAPLDLVGGTLIAVEQSGSGEAALVAALKHAGMVRKRLERRKNEAAAH